MSDADVFVFHKGTPPVPETVPARFGWPTVFRYRLEADDLVHARVTCWCRTFMVRLDGDELTEWVREHVAQHRRPRYWIHRAAERVGSRLYAWGRKP